MNALRTLILGETWALPIGVALLAVLSIAADQAGLGWWADAAGPLLLAWAIVLVIGERVAECTALTGPT